jgi:nucleoid-associated protein YgaU
MSDSGLVPAQIRRIKPPGPPIDCMFNPKEYSFTKQNSWTAGKSKGANVPHLDFGGGQAATLQMQLFFDTYSRAEDPAAVQDVRKFTGPIWELMLVDEKLKDRKNKKGRPPTVHFQWGEASSFDAVITSITQKFTLFSSRGVPVRATLDISFQQLEDEKWYPKQNPTSGGVSLHQWAVKAGDTLPWIAYSELGDATQWRLIADANRLTNVRRLRPGMVLEIPDA